MATPAYIFQVPPFMPIDLVDQQRVEEQRRRRRMLYGGWGRDAFERMLCRIGTDRSDAWGQPILTSNVFFSCADALAVLYSESGTIGNTIDPSAADDMTALLRKGGWWPLMQRYMRDTLGFREMLQRVDVERVKETGDPVEDCLPCFRPVFPDLCELIPNPSDPTRPIEITEYRQRPGGMGLVWTKERWSLLGPIHQVSDGTMDVSGSYGLPEGGASGSAYPSKYVRSDGKPVLPYVLHHAAVTGCLLDPYCWSELVEATMEIAVDKTFLSHCKRNAAFGKIVSIGCSPVEQRDVNGRNVSVSDPAVVHKFARDEGHDGAIDVKMLSQAVDIAALAETISQDTREAAVFAGVDPADFQRLDGDPRSGYALALSVEGKKKSALRYAPVMERGDIEVLSLVAVQVNRLMGAEVFPEEGWTVEYAPLREASAPPPSNAPKSSPPPAPAEPAAEPEPT